MGSDTAMVVLVLNNGTVQFHSYVPNDDSDGDGVLNTQDAFPLDVAASVDTDRDGYPDAWNAGRSQTDSTTGLTLDAFPQDSACWLAAHGSGGVCNYGATIPNYVPDQIVQHGDIVYLLSSANRRVYRWSMATGSVPQSVRRRHQPGLSARWRRPRWRIRPLTSACTSDTTPARSGTSM